MKLEVAVRKRLGTLVLDVDFTAETQVTDSSQPV